MRRAVQLGIGSFKSFAFWGVALSILSLLVFTLLQWLDVSAGSLIDWLVGIASFWWLLVVTTIPWNVHFQARAVLDGIEGSQQRKQAVAPGQVLYVRRWIRLALIIALFLHVLSALGLYALAATGVSNIGYVSSVAALLLTGLRPAVQAYVYISGRLSSIGHAARYPRDDVEALQRDLRDTAQRIDKLEYNTNPEKEGSLLAQHSTKLDQNSERLDRLRADYEQLRDTNAAEHARLSREAQQAVAQILTDGRVLDNVRELVRFFKEA